MKRDLNSEFKDSEDRLYAYNFDYIFRSYLLRYFKQFFKENSNALEIGCYKGEFTKSLLPFFDSIDVVEGSDILMNVAKNNVNSLKCNFHNSMFEDWTSDKKFDYIFLIHTLEHIENPISFLERLKSYLSSDGKLFLVVPNANAASRQVAVNMGIIETNQSVTKGESEHGHIRTYSIDSLAFEVRKAGLEIVHQTGVFFKPLANYQFDKALEYNVIDNQYLEGCYLLGHRYPDLAASIFFLCK